MLPVVSINGLIPDLPSTISPAGATPDRSSPAPTAPTAPTAAISPFDRGFTLGDGLFETMKVTQGAPWYLGKHLQRLEQGASFMGIPYPADTIHNWIGDVVHLVQTRGIHDFALRITLTRGPVETVGLSLNGSGTPTVTVVAYAPPKIADSVYTEGISALIVPARRNERGFTTSIKTTSYAESLVALKEAKSAGFDDAIFLNTRDFVAEATASNVFVCLNGVVVTPAVTQGILPGITRAVILQLAQELGISAAEREVHDEELVNADEAFLTSSLRGIVPLVKIGNYKLGNGMPGLLTKRLITAYNSASNRI